MNSNGKKLSQSQNSRTQHIVFAVLMLCALIFALWKCRYGFDGGDEPFYFDVTQRIMQGDALLKHEWHLSQLSSVLRIPILLLYRLTHSSMEGFLLCMRIWYHICHCAVCVFVYIRLRKYGYASLVSSMLYFLFGSYALFTFSYNTIAMDSLVFTGVLMATADSKGTVPFILCGISFSAAVLCSPYLAVIYVIYALCTLARLLLAKTKLRAVKETALFTDLFSGRTFLLFSAGIAACVIAFAIFVFSRASLDDIMKNLPEILFSDPEHIQEPFLKKFINYFMSVLFCCGYIYFCFFAYFLIAAAMLFDKKRMAHRSVYLFLSSAVAIATMMLIAKGIVDTYYTAVMMPVLFVGFTSYVLSEKKPKKLFCSMFVLGILYSIAVHIASNQTFLVIFMAMGVSNIAAIIFTFVVIKEIISEKQQSESENKENKNILKRVCIYSMLFAVSLQGIFELVVKYEYCYYDGCIQYVSSPLEKGPGKGIITSARSKVLYTSYYDEIDYYKDKAPDSILLLNYKAWGYLYLDDFTCSSYSAWTSGLGKPTAERLKKYYELNPEKLPKYVYLPIGIAEAMGINDVEQLAKDNNYIIADKSSVSYKLERAE